jgi:RNA polymerase sigma factor (sigma-70 family)
MATLGSDYSPAGNINSGDIILHSPADLCLPVPVLASTAPMPLVALEYSGSSAPEDMRERWLLLRVASGDGGAFWELWTPHHRRLYLICYTRMGGRVEDAEDALSEVMHRAYETLPREAPRVRNLGAWLRRIAVNLCIDLYRRNRRRNRVMDTVEFAGSASMAASPGAEFDNAELWIVITSAIDSLPSRLRVAAQLFFLKSAAYAAIASELEISEPNARKRVQEARRMLKEKLREEFPGPFEWPLRGRGNFQVQAVQRETATNVASAA